MAKMMKNQNARVCGICKHFKCHDTSDLRPEDEVGTCKITDEVVYGDDEFADSCDDFKSGKRQASKRC